MPVIFLPNDDSNNAEEEEDCEELESTQMSAFGFMSFAISIVNAVINNANNVNNNNNNNNNNDNNNNNNLGNINIANANNDVNNMNMVTAGRRRRLYKNKKGNVSRPVNPKRTLSHEVPKIQQNKSITQPSQKLIGGQEWQKDLVMPVHTISIGYINKNLTKHKHETKAAKSKTPYPFQGEFGAKVKMLRHHIAEKSEYMKSVIFNSLTKFSLQSYFPSFSLAALWSSVASNIGK